MPQSTGRGVFRELEAEPFEQAAGCLTFRPVDPASHLASYESRGSFACGTARCGSPRHLVEHVGQGHPVISLLECGDPHL